MIVLIGKTCSGKSTVMAELVKLGMKAVPEWTSRPMREGEVDGKDHKFTTREDFEQKAKEGFFGIISSFYVKDDIWHYGQAVSDLMDKDAVIITNPHTLEGLKGRIKDAVVFYITSDYELLLKRLNERDNGADSAERRISEDEKDFADVMDYVDFSVSNSMGFAPSVTAKIILDTYNTCMEHADEMERKWADG